MAEYKRQNAPYRLVIINTGTLNPAHKDTVYSDRLYMSKGGLTKEIQTAEGFKREYGWNYRIYDRQADGTWKERVVE
jgi:hypothetical protein